MQKAIFHNRRAIQIENDSIRVTTTEEGGHIAEILNKTTGVNPLWIPPWLSIEASAWSPVDTPEYGEDADAQLLAAIMGHNLCLDLFGPPSADEQAAGVGTHGEAGIVPWDFESSPAGLMTRCVMPLSQLAFQRVIALDGRTLRIRETVENLAAHDRPIAWTQHVTLGPPFLERGQTEFCINTSKSCPTANDDGQETGLEADQAGPALREILSTAPSSGGYRAFLMDEDHADSYFIAWSPSFETALAYSWKHSDFPWIGIWDENRLRQHKPWNGRVLARGLEFGVSPFPETRKEMIERGELFNTPVYRWLPAKGKLTAEFHAATIEAKHMPASLAAFDA
jgi:hypothetical protein